MLFLALLLPQTADDLYRDLQARLRKAQTLQIEAHEFYSDRGRTYRFQRPNRAHLNLQAVDFRTDGIRTRITDNGELHHRATQPEDLRQWMTLPGFEAFYDPMAKVEGTATPRSLDHPTGPLTVLELKIDGKPTTVYLNATTGLPRGAGKLHPASPYFDLSYRQVELDAQFPPIAVPPLPTPGQVLARMTGSVGALSQFTVRFDSPLGLDTEILRVTKTPKGIIVKGRVPNRLPGFEAFFGRGSLGTPEGPVATSNRYGGSYVVHLRHAHKRWDLHVGWDDFLPRGFDEFVDGNLKASVGYQISDIVPGQNPDRGRPVRSGTPNFTAGSRQLHDKFTAASRPF